MVTTNEEIQTYVQSRLAEAKPGMSLEQWEDLIFDGSEALMTRFPTIQDRAALLTAIKEAFKERSKGIVRM
jgi:hypothetical protein